MTNIEDKVVSRELATELKEAGFEQDSVFWSFCGEDTIYIKIGNILIKKNDIGKMRSFSLYKDKIIARPLPCEIMERLPLETHGDKIRITRFLNGDYVGSFGLPPRFQDEKFADALAKMWLYLKKENLL